MNSLSPQSIQAQLETETIGKRIHLFAELDSTNSEAFRMALEGGEEGAVVVADRQLRGKGRLGRSWLSPPGVNLYVSIILRPPIAARNGPLITLMAAVATAKAMERISGVRPRIKWPNDLLINGRKVAGLLNEMKCEGDRVKFVVLGVGINVNMSLATVPQRMRPTATSLREELCHDFSRVELLKALLQEVEGEYRALLAGGRERILRQWEEFSQMVGKVVEIRSFNQVIQGRVRGVGSNGSLILSTSDGSERRVIAGDVSQLGDRRDGGPEVDCTGG